MRPAVRLKRRRSKAQSIVEFGGIAVFLTLLIAAVIDFAVLMNDWLTVASDASQLARDAAVGADNPQLIATASKYPITGVTTEGGWFSQYCCSATDGQHGDALVLTITYYNQCTPNVGSCPAVDSADPSLNGLDSRYGLPHGSCVASPPQTCAHPARPSPAGTGTCPVGGNSCPGDTVQVTFTAAAARVLTPMLQGLCPNNQAPYCNVPMTSTVTMRFDGVGF